MIPGKFSYLTGTYKMLPLDHVPQGQEHYRSILDKKVDYPNYANIKRPLDTISYSDKPYRFDKSGFQYVTQEEMERNQIQMAQPFNYHPTWIGALPFVSDYYQHGYFPDDEGILGFYLSKKKLGTETDPNMNHIKAIQDFLGIDLLDYQGSYHAIGILIKYQGQLYARCLGCYNSPDWCNCITNHNVSLMHYFDNFVPSVLKINKSLIIKGVDGLEDTLDDYIFFPFQQSFVVNDIKFSFMPEPTINDEICGNTVNITSSDDSTSDSSINSIDKSIRKKRRYRSKKQHRRNTRARPPSPDIIDYGAPGTPAQETNTTTQQLNDYEFEQINYGGADWEGDIGNDLATIGAFDPDDPEITDDDDDYGGPHTPDPPPPSILFPQFSGEQLLDIRAGSVHDIDTLRQLTNLDEPTLRAGHEHAHYGQDIMDHYEFSILSGNIIRTDLVTRTVLDDAIDPRYSYRPEPRALYHTILSRVAHWNAMNTRDDPEEYQTQLNIENQELQLIINHYLAETHQGHEVQLLILVARDPNALAPFNLTFRAGYRGTPAQQLIQEAEDRDNADEQDQ